MMSQPTTAQILADCRRELTEVIAPAISDSAVAVSVAMVDDILKNCAVRASHEIAWMHEESKNMIDYARTVAAATPDAKALTASLATYDAEPNDSLHLDDMAASYSRAGYCLSEAIGACQDTDNVELLAQGRTLVDQRLEHEEEIKGDWGFVGRG